MVAERRASWRAGTTSCWPAFDGLQLPVRAGLGAEQLAELLRAAARADAISCT